MNDTKYRSDGNGGVDSDGRIRITAVGDDRADYYPKFCPECGRKLSDD